MPTQAQGAIDPATVPQRTLYTGAEMPAIGLGTFGSDQVSAAEIAATVKAAATVGYRHFDCASVYGNEKEIGAALEEIVRRYPARRSSGSRQSCGTIGTAMSSVRAASRLPICGWTTSTST